MSETIDKPGVSRRDFLIRGAKLGVALVSAPYVLRSAPKGDSLNVALIGCGAAGRVLLNAALRIPNIRFHAVCDIWDYNRTYGERLLNKFGHDAKPFEDYREMLSAVPDLDAVIIATPDFMHAEHTNACLRASKHVYCEKLMANTIENARSMMQTQDETGRLLQIGHQRRSNPRYQFALHQVINQAHLLGRITTINSHWNRAVSEDLGWPARYAIPEATLHKYGYENMHQFRNWRWFKKYGGGPIADLGAHQIDVFNWFLGTNPSTVLAGGGADYYTTHQWYDNVMTIFEYPTPTGIVRALYEVLTTTSAGGGYCEMFMGDEGTLKMSEDSKYTKLYREARAPDWEPWIKKGFIRRPGTGEEGAQKVKPWEKQRPNFSLGGGRDSVVDVRETAALSAFELNATLDEAIHQPHLENFFAAIRGKEKLNCPAETGFATAVTILRVNQAVAAGKLLDYQPKDFHI